MFEANERISRDAPYAFYRRSKSHAHNPPYIAEGLVARLRLGNSASSRNLVRQTLPPIDRPLVIVILSEDHRAHVDHDLVLDDRTTGIVLSVSARRIGFKRLRARQIVELVGEMMPLTAYFGRERSAMMPSQLR